MSKLSVSSVTPHWNGFGLHKVWAGQHLAGKVLQEWWVSSASGLWDPRAQGLAPAACIFRVLSQCSLEWQGLVGLPLTAAGSWWKSWFPWRGAAPCGQGLSSQSCSLFVVQSKAAKRSINFPASQYTSGTWCWFCRRVELLASDIHLQVPDAFLLPDVYFS